ncbi:MAG: HD domain-containing protein [Planctomycetes bacterium]|nr:HD domain-containing protein [Planctomycetota bacterium]
MAPLVADAGVEVLGEPDFYAQLLTAPDVGFLVESTLRRLAATDFAETETEITALLELFATVTDAHASDKVGHSRRVASLAVMVALALGLGSEQQARVRWTALIHDVGVITVPKSLLDQPRLLSRDEVAEVRRQVSRVEELLAPISGLEDVIHTAACHAEAFDGSGYPAGLEGTDIPLGARIITICDTFDALTSRRPYREARDTALAVDILLRGSGSLFDPDVVAAAVPVFLISQSAEEMQATVG